MQAQSIRTAGGGFFHPFARSLAPVCVAASQAAAQDAPASPPPRAQDASAANGLLHPQARSPRG